MPCSEPSRRIREQAEEEKLLLVRLTARPGAECAVVCFPWAGAGAAAFSSWAELFPHDVELWAVRLPGRESRIRERPFRSLVDAAEAVALALRDGPDPPLVLFGHSMGARLAYETARLLERDLGRPPRFVVPSGAPAPIGAWRGPRLHELEDEPLWDAVASMNGMPEAVRTDRSLQELFIPLLRADLTMVETYVGAGAPLGVPITVYAGRADRSLDASAVERWHACSRAGVSIRWFDGGHFFLREQEERVVEQLVDDIRMLRGPRP